MTKFVSDLNRRISKTTKATTEQPYFKHIFVNARETDESEDEDNVFQEYLNINFQF